MTLNGLFEDHQSRDYIGNSHGSHGMPTVMGIARWEWEWERLDGNGREWKPHISQVTTAQVAD